MAIGVGVHALASHATSATTAARTTQNPCSYEVNISFDGTFGSITDSKGNTPLLVAEQAGVSGFITRKYKVEGGVGGAGHQITATAADVTVDITEITGGAVFDIDAKQNTASSPYVSPGITPSAADSVLIGVIVCDGGNPSVVTWGNSFTENEAQQDGNTYWPTSIATRVVAAIATYNTSVTVSTTPANTTTWISAWKLAGGGADSLMAQICL